MNCTGRLRSAADIRTLGKNRSISQRNNKAAEFLNLYVLKNEQERLKQVEVSLTSRLRRVRERLAEVETHISRGLQGVEPAKREENAPNDSSGQEGSVPEKIKMPSLRRVSVMY